MKANIPLIATLIALSGTAAAQDAEGQDKPRRGFDLERMEARGDRMFDAADADRDGTVTEAEFMATEPPRGRRGHRAGPGPEMATEIHREVFAALDTDGNGQISEVEFARLREVMHAVTKARMFARLDANGDGVLTRDEASRNRERMSAMDTDGDGKVSREEIRASKTDTEAE